MIPRVVWLEDASQTVRLLARIERGRQQEGEHADPRRRDDAGDAKALATSQAVAPAAPRAKAAASSAPSTATSGASIVQGMAP